MKTSASNLSSYRDGRSYRAALLEESPPTHISLAEAVTNQLITKEIADNIINTFSKLYKILPGKPCDSDRVANNIKHSIEYNCETDTAQFREKFYTGNGSEKYYTFTLRHAHLILQESSTRNTNINMQFVKEIMRPSEEHQGRSR